jgi:hypothetical protein
MLGQIVSGESPLAHTFWRRVQFHPRGDTGQPTDVGAGASTGYRARIRGAFHHPPDMGTDVLELRRMFLAQSQAASTWPPAPARASCRRGSRDGNLCFFWPSGFLLWLALGKIGI